MSEENKDPQESGCEENDERTYKLAVRLSLFPKGDKDNAMSFVETETELPFLLDNDQLLLAEPRFRQALDGAIEAFTLRTTIKLNKMIEANKDSGSQEVVHQPEEGVVGLDDIEIDET